MKGDRLQSPSDASTGMSRWDVFNGVPFSLCAFAPVGLEETGSENVSPPRTYHRSPLGDIDISGRFVWSSSRNPGGSCMICITYDMFPALDLYSLCTDPTRHLITVNAGSTLDYIDDIDYFDRDRSEV